MAIHYAHGKTTSSARLKVLLSGLVGLLAALVASKVLKGELVPLLGWDAAAATYVVWEWLVIRRMSGADTAAHAVREDPSRGIANAVVLVASVASLAAVAVVLSEAGKAHGTDQILLVALAVISVVVAWIAVHTLFMLRYAELYYGDTPGGVDFAGTTRPAYHDFAYLSFTMGMTFQVSDTGFTNSAFRRLALRHALISYLFGTIIVATTINLVAGLTK